MHVCLLLCGVLVVIGDVRANPHDSITTTIRRKLNLGSTFGSVSSTKKITPYERVTGHPVFAVTTSWGSPYMTMEKITQDETIPTNSNDINNNNNNKKKPTSLSEEQVEYRRVALYFLDPADAIAAHNEMLQQPGDTSQQQPDIRITAFSLAKALRQASILGYGLPTGVPPDPLNGKFNIEEGATLRYKLVPSKKQLYYAARCIGKERVGLCSNSGSGTPTTGAKEDAITALIGNSAIEAANLARRREQRERKIPKKQEARNSTSTFNADHMVGYTGIPVFYCPSMKRPISPVQQVLTGLWTRRRYEVPLFFNYEDLIMAWDRLRSKKSTKGELPEEPPSVEVFNLWDVVTSMDRYQNTVSRRGKLNFLKRQKNITKKKRPSPAVATTSTLQDIIFVPNSDSVHYKDAISKRGNGKARLRPMRESIYRPLD